MQTNCPRMGLYSTMSCTGYTCQRRWRYSSYLTSVCLVLAVEDAQVPAVCDLQISGESCRWSHQAESLAYLEPLLKTAFPTTCWSPLCAMGFNIFDLPRGSR